MIRLDKPSPPGDSPAASIEFTTGPTGGSRLVARQFLPQTPGELFGFFGDAFQLEALTPPFLQFRVLTPPPIEMRSGLTIDYRLRLRGIPLRWRSLIEVWEPPFQFVDRQLRGPYRAWRHLHRFEACAGGTWCEDIVDYRVPGGRWLERFIVRPDLLRIFSYRQAVLAATFAGSGESQRSAGSAARAAEKTVH